MQPQSDWIDAGIFDLALNGHSKWHHPPRKKHIQCRNHVGIPDGSAISARYINMLCLPPRVEFPHGNVGCQGFIASGNLLRSYWKRPFIVSLSMKDSDLNHSYLSLPQIAIWLFKRDKYLETILMISHLIIVDSMSSCWNRWYLT